MSDLALQLIEREKKERTGKLSFHGIRMNIIPEYIEELFWLKDLDISNHNISNISSLEKLSGLQKLDLSHNMISDIRFLEKLTGLQTLDLRSNQISDISPLIPVLKKGMDISFREYGRGIRLNKNPITTPPIEVVKQGREAVLRYFGELENEVIRPLNEAKLLIIGAGGVGKTSFMRKLKEPDNPLPGEEDTTVGITVSQEPKTFNSRNQEITLHMWDFGGQDIYHPTHQFFLTKNSIYVLMQDGREQKTDFYYWLQVQELLAAKSPLFIVQNIKHNNRSSIPMNELRGKFGNIKGYFEVDLATVGTGHQGFEQIERVLQTTQLDLPHIGEPWPARRFAIRDELISLRERNYISYSEFQDICNGHEYTDPQGQKELAQQLHDLGTVLHFQGTPALKDIVITNPQWATDAVYEILNHTRNHYKKRGHFTLDDLIKVFTGGKYEGVHYQILNLMEKFELCFELHDAKYTYIAPLLLPDDQPEYNWNDQSNLQMKYRYDFMPKGIMARLIVRMHRYVRNNLFWQRGMVLEYKGTGARVTEDYASRNITISVKGEYAKELIFMIYSAIDEINGSYYFSDRFKAIKLIPCNCDKCRTLETPNFYEFEDLERRIKSNKQTVECKLNNYKEVNVKSLMDYITPDKTKEEEAPAQLFISYAHSDNKFKDKLEVALSVQKNTGKVEIWSDLEIMAGANWDEEIETHLRAADIIVLLLSDDFFASEYIWDKELPIVKERYEAKTAKVVPVLLRDCDWEDTEYRKIQAVPIEPYGRKLLPISLWKNPSTAWNIVVKGIKKLI